MKTFIIHFFLGLFFITSALAQNQPSSSMYVYAQNGESFYLVLNGIRQNYYPQSSVQLSGLTGTDYSVQVVFKNGHLGKIGPVNCSIVDASFQYGQSIYKVGINDMGFYDFTLEHFFPGFTLMPTNQTHHVVSYHNVTYDQPPAHHPFHPISGQAIGSTITCLPTCTPNHHVCGITSTTEVAQPAPPANPMPNYNGVVGCADWPISDQDFQRALQSIQKKDFDRTKLVVAKQITRVNCLTALQVKKIASLFDFDSAKLEYAKFAYEHTYDIGNYFIVNDVFDFDKNARELSLYITNK